MPRQLTQQELKAVKYVSMSDYIRRVERLEDFQDKMDFTTRYLLSYGGQQRDVSFAEAVHVAKVTLAMASSKIRDDRVMVPPEAVNPDVSAEEDAPNRLFMIEPVAFLQQQAHDLLLQEDENDHSEQAQRRIADYQVTSAILANDYNGSLSNEISELDIDSIGRDFKTRLNSKFGGHLEEAHNAAKPGFLSRLFSASARAYHNLDQAYKAFDNPNHALYGNTNALDKAAKEYLHHCFPRWNPKGPLMNRGAIERLSGTKKAQAMFAFNILQTTPNLVKGEQVYEEIMTANLQLRADAEANAGDEVLEDLPVVDNEQFQHEVQNDVENEGPGVESEEERAYHANFENIPDEVEEDEGPELE